MRWILFALLLPQLAHAEPDPIGAKLDESIAALKIVVAHAAPAEKPLLVFRLADLHWQKGDRRTAVSLYRFAAAKATERADEIRFQLAYALYEVGELEEAVQVYAEVARLFPRSRFAVQANLQLGEHWFETDQLNRAQQAFERAFDGGDREVRDHALYKLAWCDFNRGEYRIGIDKLKHTTYREAERDLALFYAHAEDLDDAFAWLRSRAPEQLVRMAAHLDEQGKWTLAIAARRRLLRERIGDPTSNRIGLIEALARTGRDLIPEAKELDLSRADQASKDRVLALATEQHRAKAHAAAEILYRLADDREARYFHAGVLFELGRFREAAQQYAAVTGAHREAAAHDAVIAWEKVMDDDRSAAASFVEAVRRYAAISPDDHAALPRFYFKAAHELHLLDRLEEERAQLLEIATRFPNDPLGPKSAKLLIARLEEAKDWAALEKHARAFGLGRAAEGAAYKRIQSDESRVRGLSGTELELGLAEVADAFARFAGAHLGSEFADEALLSAAMIYSEIGRVDAALEASSFLAERYGSSEHAARNALLYAELHERIADFERAARIYDQFAHDHPDHEHAPGALQQAAVHYVASGKTELAKKAFARYATLFPLRKDATEARLKACEIDLDLKRWKAADRCFAGAGSSVVALSGRAQALSSMSRPKLARRLFASALRAYDGLEESERSRAMRSAAARAAFELAEVELPSYRRMRIRDERSFVRMAAKLERERGLYSRVLEYGDAEHSIAALTRLGEIYAAMADAIRNAPLPAGLTLEQLQIYRSALEEQIVVMRTRAIEAYELALSRGRELAIAGRWTTAASVGLSALLPDTPVPQPAPQTEPIDQLDRVPIREAKGFEAGPD